MLWVSSLMVTWPPPPGNFHQPPFLSRLLLRRQRAHLRRLVRLMHPLAVLPTLHRCGLPLLPPLLPVFLVLLLVRVPVPLPACTVLVLALVRVPALAFVRVWVLAWFRVRVLGPALMVLVLALALLRALRRVLGLTPGLGVAALLVLALACALVSLLARVRVLVCAFQGLGMGPALAGLAWGLVPAPRPPPLHLPLARRPPAQQHFPLPDLPLPLPPLCLLLAQPRPLSGVPLRSHLPLWLWLLPALPLPPRRSPNPPCPPP